MPKNNPRYRVRRQCLVYAMTITVSLVSTLVFSMNVTFINPAHIGSTFWDANVDFMQHCAKDLNIDLNIIYRGDSSGKKIPIDLRTQISSLDRPDYLIGNFERGNSYKLLNIAEELSIGLYSINNRPIGKQQDHIGTPRSKYKQWLGMMYPDDIEAGFTLAKYLIEESMSKKPLVNIIAIGGGESDSATIERLAGLSLALEKYPNAKLIRTVYTNWSDDQAQNKLTKLLKRHPQVDVVWAASDELSIGARRAINHSQIANPDILTGGFDWSSNGLSAIKSNNISASLGGHFIEGGLALVLLYDYHHKQDFKLDPGLIIKTKMQLINQDNLKQLFPSDSKIQWRDGDCMKLAKSYSNITKPYNFNWGAIRPSVTNSAVIQ